jgi:hypothetical protein
MWWVPLGFVAALAASCVMMVYWFYRLRSAMAEKGWKYTSYLWVLVWIAIFFGSASGLLRMSMAIKEGSIIDNILFYTPPILYGIAVTVLVAGMIVDAVKRVQRT